MSSSGVTRRLLKPSGGCKSCWVCAECGGNLKAIIASEFILRKMGEGGGSV